MEVLLLFVITSPIYLAKELDMLNCDLLCCVLFESQSTGKPVRSTTKVSTNDHILKVLFSFEPKTERNYFLISALMISNGSNKKN
jgi:hypothetical protein